MIGISTKVYDTAGARLFMATDMEIEMANRSGARRVSRTPTLDGGVVVSDTGYADGDRDFIVTELNAAKEAVDYAQYIVENYGLINVATRDGVYTAVPESYNISRGTLSLRLLITEKLSE